MSEVRMLVLLIGFGVVVVGCARDDRPNLVLITLDTTRADRIGAYGDSEAQTPNLDALAARGALFERAFTSTPVTLPSHTSILTGLGPEQHGVLDNGRFVAKDTLETVAEKLTAVGYRSGAFVSAFVLDSVFGLTQGFEVYDDDVLLKPDPLETSVARRTATDVTNRAIAWLRGNDGPFFVWAHYYDVHLPQTPPPPFDAIEDSYAGALAYVDREVARLLAEVDVVSGSRPRFVVVVGDHGEAMGEHGEATHGLLAYDATLRVPLIVAGPGVAPGTRSQRFARGADVAPTLLEAAGESWPGVDSVALQHILAGRTQSDRTAFFQSSLPVFSFGWSRLAGVRTERWKYTAEPLPAELYDLLADPEETNNRAAEEPHVVAQLQQKFRAYDAQADAADGPVALSVDTAEKLEMLGYVSVARPTDGDVAPDPRRFAAAPPLIQRARNLAQDGHVAEGIEALTLLAELPVARPMALRGLGSIFLAAGRPADAIRAFTELHAMAPTSDVRAQLVRALLQADRIDDAQAIVDAPHGTTDAADDRLLLLRARVALEAGNAEQANRLAEDVLARDPDDDRVFALASRTRVALTEDIDGEIHRLKARLTALEGRYRHNRTRALLADLLRRQGRASEAVRILEDQESIPVVHLHTLAEIARDHGNPEKAADLYATILAERPADVRGRRALAFLAGDLGRFEQAMSLYADLMAADPSNAALWLERGVTFLQMGRPDEATADLRHAVELDPKLPEPWYNLGRMTLGTGNLIEAERSFRNAVQHDPGYTKAHLELAGLYRRQGKAALAEQHAKLAVEALTVSVWNPRQPDSDSAQENKLH